MLLMPMFEFIGDLFSRITLPGFLMFVEFAVLIAVATALMLRFWKITAGIGLLMFGLVCWQEPSVLFYSALSVFTVWLIPTIGAPLATFIFDRKRPCNF